MANKCLVISERGEADGISATVNRSGVIFAIYSAGGALDYEITHAGARELAIWILQNITKPPSQ